jgi:hypothetical protein
MVAIPMEEPFHPFSIVLLAVFTYHHSMAMFFSVFEITDVRAIWKSYFEETKVSEAVRFPGMELSIENIPRSSTGCYLWVMVQRVVIDCSDR